MVVQLSGSLLNSTYVQNSELHAYLPEGWEEKLDSLIDNAYTYGREGISTAVSINLEIYQFYYCFLSHQVGSARTACDYSDSSSAFCQPCLGLLLVVVKLPPYGIINAL